jgi:hypothetical protein
VLGLVDHGRGLVVLVLEHDVVAVLGDGDEPGLERGVDLAEGHVDGHGLVGREEGILRLRRLDAHLLARDIGDVQDRELGIHVPEALREESERAGALHVLGDSLKASLMPMFMAFSVGFVPEDEVGKHTGLRHLLGVRVALITKSMSPARTFWAVSGSEPSAAFGNPVLNLPPESSPSFFSKVSAMKL